jgi:hypothetical protein
MRHKRKKHHITIRIFLYSLSSAIVLGGVIYLFRGVFEPHETLKLVEFSTTAMLLAEDLA